MSRSEQALTQDVPFPPMEKGKLRLYSMRFCPYAQRSRIVLAHYKVPHETVNIHLKSKPTWYFDKNPNGTVPAYEKDGQVLYESGVVCDFIDQVYGNGELYPKDPYLKAKAKILMESASKYTGPYYKLYFAQPDDPNKAANIETFQNALQFFENHLEDKFFNGSKAGMVDYFLWPHMERLPGLGMILKEDLMPKNRFPKLNAWTSAIRAEPAIKATAFSDEDHKGFIESVHAKKANYDYGL